jgi:hypothetical protein
MHMVRLNIHFHNLYLLLLGKRPNAIAHFVPNVSRQYPMTIFDEPVKSQNPDGFEKSFKLRRVNLEE